MAAKKVETPTLGATVRFAGADASTGLFQLEVEMASAAAPWKLTTPAARPKSATVSIVDSLPEYSTTGRRVCRPKAAVS